MSKHPVMCDLCGEGTLEEKQGVNTVTYKSVTRELSTDYCECDTCGVEMTLPQQTRDNKRRMVAFKKEVDGLLTGAEVKALRERLSLKQKEAAKVFGGGAVAFSKYESDDVTQSEAMDKLMRLADRFPDVYQELRSKVGLTVSSNVIRPAIWHSLAKDAANENNVDENFMQVAETQIEYAGDKQFGVVGWEDCKEC
ncbi:type II toxin-antitoxin system MqsA family antitoxin [Pseudidiomarina sp. YC-516-91]|uniref:type II toxin-antitoxin system MqsA family antitoxin n=1 Tax=Pseudidiomarina salilacus TaxID=3384452 RepID=UPI0039851ADA